MAGTGALNACVMPLHRTIKPTPEEPVFTSVGFKCTDLGDHINALLGIAEDINCEESDLRRNYRASAASVFREFAV